jgi:uncharacterized protein YijF (DUF1287 family)
MNENLRNRYFLQRQRERRILFVFISIAAILCVIGLALTINAQFPSVQTAIAVNLPTLVPISTFTQTPRCSPVSLVGIPTPSRNGLAIANAARTQVGVTTMYDAAYTQIAYPNGDVPLERGVCTDVVIRAFRKIGMDLQVNVHEDMAANFSVYPKDWGLTRTDTNIDHRRVPNLMKYFERKSKSQPIASAYIPGDVVAWRLSTDGWMTHIGVVSSELAPCTNRYMIVHNIGAGTREEDALNWWTIIGHYRW